MDTMITLLKQNRNKTTLRQVSMEDVVQNMCNSEYAQEVKTFREIYPLVQVSRAEDGTLTMYAGGQNTLPRICFGAEMVTKGNNRLIRSYTGLVLLEVNNLRGTDEAEAVRRGAGEMPQTLLAFVGADGLSVKIVCRGELYPSEGGGLPKGKQAVEDFHQNLYERARLIYNGQMGITIEKLNPMIERVCYMSADENVIYNPYATVILAHAEKVEGDNLNGDLSVQRAHSIPDRQQLVTMREAYEFLLTNALDAAENIVDEEEQRHVVLTLLAGNCQKHGLPMALACGMAQANVWLGRDKLLVDKVFENAYRREHSRRYKEQKGADLAGTLPAETLLTMKIDMFLKNNYDLRRNVLRGVAEYRSRKGLGFAFHDITEEARNSITMRALEQGIRCWDKDIRRYVNSNDIALYDPVNDYLDHLMPWDGEDRVTPLAQRVPTDYEDWTHLFHIWMRSMVAMWLGKGQLTGNALVPLLIGRQGCGKSSFCRILLPRELADYYNDRINFKNEHDLNIGLSSFALINLDEFDKITQRQQIVLKYLVSTADLRYRPPYGKAFTVNRRYTSFIGTTNEPTPLTDPTGSRRFICVDITGNIDFQTPVYHDQLYAQLLQEIVQGERYWLTKDEEAALTQHNRQFQRPDGLEEMLLNVIRQPENDRHGEWLLLKDISALLKQQFKGFQEDHSTLVKIGKYLSRPEYKFKSKRTKIGTMYWVAKK